MTTSKRQKFLLLVEQHRVNLIKLLVARKISLADASDIAHDVIVKLLEGRSYLKIDTSKESHNGYNFLRTAILNAAKNSLRKQQFERSIVAAVGTSDDNPDDISAFLVNETYKAQEVECPFCFKGPLNQYGACFRCGTIVGTDRTVKRTGIKLDEVGYDSTINTAVDVRNAISLLSDFEQLVVTQIIDGNESLTTLSDVSDRTRKTLWRTWIRAKQKLQKILVAYDTRTTKEVEAA